MVRCSDCETPNSVDSKFCKFCGALLPEEERVDAQVKLNELIAEGYKLFNEGRTDEAALIAESALTSSPTDTQALSLKGMCHERQGDLAEALEVYERVVELNPDSPLDKIKVTHVRNLLALRVAEGPRPNRRVAIIGAAAAIVLVMAAGAIMASAAAGSSPTAAKKAAEQTDPTQVVGFEPGLVGAAQQQQNPTTQPNPNPNPQPDQKQAPPIDTGPSPFRPFPVVGPELPIVGPVGKVEKLPGEGNPSPKPVDNGTGTSNPADEPPKVPTNAGPPPEDPMKGIDIVVIRPGDKTNGGSMGVDGPKQLETLLKTGREQFMLGNHAAAAKTYERAVRAGGDPAFLNQRLGQCYAALGRKSEALNAYTKAVSAYEAAISQHGQTAALKSGLESCKAAMKVLRS